MILIMIFGKKLKTWIEKENKSIHLLDDNVYIQQIFKQTEMKKNYIIMNKLPEGLMTH